MKVIEGWVIICQTEKLPTFMFCHDGCIGDHRKIVDPGGSQAACAQIVGRLCSFPFWSLKMMKLLSMKLLSIFTLSTMSMTHPCIGRTYALHRFARWSTTTLVWHQTFLPQTEKHINLGPRETYKLVITWACNLCTTWGRPRLGGPKHVRLHKWARRMRRATLCEVAENFDIVCINCNCV